MARALLLKRPSPFAFPGGSPGFDPSHPAGKVAGAGNGLLSFVAQGGNLLNLNTGKPGTSPTGITSSLTGIGPAVTATVGGANAITFSGMPPGTATTSVTAGAIIYVASIPSTNQGFISSQFNTSNGFNFSFVGGSSFVGLKVYSGATNFIVSTLALTVGHSYFIGCSGASGSMNFVMIDLGTGRISTNTQSTTYSAQTSSTTYMFGANGQDGAGGGIAAAAGMILPGLTISKAALLAWAQDPWSFWYPSTLDLSMMLAAPSAAGGSFIPYNPWPLSAPILAQ